MSVINLEDFDFEECYRFVKPKKNERLTKRDLQSRVTRYLSAHFNRYDFANDYDATMTIVEVMWEMSDNTDLLLNQTSIITKDMISQRKAEHEFRQFRL